MQITEMTEEQVKRFNRRKLRLIRHIVVTRNEGLIPSSDCAAKCTAIMELDNSAILGVAEKLYLPFGSYAEGEKVERCTLGAIAAKEAAIHGEFSDTEAKILCDAAALIREYGNKISQKALKAVDHLKR